MEQVSFHSKNWMQNAVQPSLIFAWNKTLSKMQRAGAFMSICFFHESCQSFSRSILAQNTFLNVYRRFANEKLCFYMMCPVKMTLLDWNIKWNYMIKGIIDEVFQTNSQWLGTKKWISSNICKFLFCRSYLPYLSETKREMCASGICCLVCSTP